MYSNNIRTVAKAVCAVLETCRGQLTDALTQSGIGLEMGTILPFYTDNVDIGMYPLVMVDQQEESVQWAGMPVIADETYSMKIWGMIHYDDPAIRAEAIGALGGALKNIWNRHHITTEIQDVSIYFNESLPIKQIQYGSAIMKNGVVSAFLADFSANIRIALPDSRNPAQSQNEEFTL